MPNPFSGSRGYARLSNFFMVPLFRLLPAPRGFALLAVTGRRSGKLRQRPVRAIRHEDTLYAVAMLGERSDWLHNVRAEPRLEAKVGTRRYQGRARQITDARELNMAEELYVEEVVAADYSDYIGYHWGFPTPVKIRKAHRNWAADGVMIAIDLDTTT